jgi:hypothetical protein
MYVEAGGSTFWFYLLDSATKELKYQFSENSSENLMCIDYRAGRGAREEVRQNLAEGERGGGGGSVGDAGAVAPTDHVAPRDHHPSGHILCPDLLLSPTKMKP